MDERIIKIVIVMLMLLIFSIYDMRYKMLPRKGLYCFIICGFIFFMIEKQPIIEGMMAGLPGLCLLVLGKLTREKIGYGDGLCIIGLGLFMELRGLEIILLISFGLSAIAAILFMVFGHKNKDFEMPFIPFLCAGFASYLVMGAGLR